MEFENNTRKIFVMQVDKELYDKLHEAPPSREEMLLLLAKHIKDLLAFPASKDMDGIEKLMRLYFEQLDKMNP